MSLAHVKDTPTKRLFERKFEFWIPRKYMVTDYEDQVAGVYASGVPEIDAMQMNEEVPARMNIPSAAELAARGAKMRVGNPDVNAMVIFKMLLEHAEYVKENLQDVNVRAPDLEATQKLEQFTRMMWEVARRRIKDPKEFSQFNHRMAELMTRRRLGLGRRRGEEKEAEAQRQEQLRAIRRSDFEGTEMERLIVRRNQSRRP